MCSPDIARSVQQRIQREGLPQFSRRHLFRLGGSALAVAGLSAIGSTVMPASASPAAYGYGGVVDLSHVLSPDFPVFPSFKPAAVETLVTVENDGFYAQQWTFGEHTSTHMDFPAHFIADGNTVDVFEVSNLIGDAVVIDISARVTPDTPDETLTVDDLTAWESANGKIPTGAYVFMYSGWETRLKEPGAYLNTADNGSLHFPGFSKEAAEWLVSERTICGIGVDTLSLDVGASTTYDVHYTILGAGLLGIEGVANLAKIKDRKARIVCGIPRYQNGSGGPVRLLALTEY